MRRLISVLVALIAVASFVHPALASHDDYIWLEGSILQPRVEYAADSCQCAGCSAGSKSKSGVKPQSSDNQVGSHGQADQMEMPWSF